MNVIQENKYFKNFMFYLMLGLLALTLQGCIHDEQEGNAELTNLVLSAGTLTPSFNSTTFIYAMIVDYSVASTTVTATVKENNYDILLINNNRETSGEESGSVALNVGENEIKIQVFGKNGGTENYVVIISRADENDNAGLSALETSNGMLSPTFNRNINNYTISVENTTETIQVSGTCEAECYSVLIDNIPSASGRMSEAISLSVGHNEISIAVTAEDEITTNTYLITVDRAEITSNDTSLSNLSLSSGILSPAFNVDVYNYTAAVPYESANVVVTPIVTDTDALVTVNGNAASTAITLSEGENHIEIKVTAADGVTTKTTTLVVTRAMGVLFAQDAYIKASDNTEFDRFSHVIAASENTLVVGTPYDDINGDNYEDSGAVYVFTRSSEGIWSQQAKLKSMYPNVRDYFGYSVDIDEDTIVVGAYFEDSNAIGVDGEQNNNGGLNSGAVYVFTRNGTTWTQTAFLKSSNPGNEDFFGISVAIDDGIIAVGAPREDGDSTGVNNEQNNNLSNSGATYLFNYQSDAWVQVAYIKASNSDGADGFGKKVALSHGTLAVSSNDDSASTGVNGDQTDNSADVAGAVYIFTNNTGDWTQQAYIKASNTEGGDIFGASIAVSLNSLVVGATGESSSYTGIDAEQSDNNADSSGAVYVFRRMGNNWQQEAYIKPANTDELDGFGNAVAIDGSVIVVGSSNESSATTGVNNDALDNSATNSGAAYMFILNGNDWSEQAYIKASNTEEADKFGYAVAIGGGFVSIGSRSESSNATGINGEQNNEDSNGSGAIYSFSGVLLNDND